MASHNKNEAKVEEQRDQADLALVALVKYLARRAAERDYKTIQRNSADQAKTHFEGETDS